MRNTGQVTSYRIAVEEKANFVSQWRLSRESGGGHNGVRGRIMQDSLKLTLYRTLPALLPDGVVS